MDVSAEKTDTLGSYPPTPRSWRVGIGAGVIVLGLVAYALRDVIGHRGQAATGVVCFIGIVAACSTNLRAVRWRTIFCGLFLQVLLALLILRFAVPGRPEGMTFGTWAGHVVRFESTDAPDVRPGYALFGWIGGIIKQFLDFTNDGSRFVFGKLADPVTMDRVFEGEGFIFAFSALPTIIFVSSFFTVLYYFGILQFVVRIMARGMMNVLGTSGAESLSAVANVFMGQTEAPLIVKPYVLRMTRSELLALMVGGMATISGGVMAVYIQMGADEVAILATSVMAAPCGLYLSKLMLPETELPETHGRAQIASEKLHGNAIDAAAAGASDGMYLALNVAAMLIAFLAFIALFNALIGGIKPTLLTCGFPPEMLIAWPDNLSLAMIFSWIFAPVAFLIGAAAQDIAPIADLLGTKLVANEFVAYVKLTTPAAEHGYHDVISPRGYALATYALTGFANFASIGIQLGGIGSLAPARRPDLAALGGRALLCGFLATLINAAIAGIMMSE